MNDALVKVVTSEIPFLQKYFLNDISLKVRGPEEDKAYTFIEGLRKNIRRGNTLLSDPFKTVKCIRRGAKKFFDLNRSYLEKNLSGMDTENGQNETNGDNKNEDEHLKIQQNIFDDLENYLTTGLGSVSIYKTNKANGENIQVSYSRELQGWIIASKNVALVARKEEDLSLYTNDRYHFAKLIGKCWFDIVKKLEEQNGAMNITDLKIDLSEVTIVGEYTGNQNYQHLIKYEKVDLIFYSVINNWGEDDYWPIEKAMGFFEKYNLSKVKYSVVKGIKGWKEFNEELVKMYDEVASSSIEVGEEGSVLYIVKNNQDGSQVINSVCKLKTLEYRILRKLREKLRFYVEKPFAKRADCLEKFKEQCEELVQQSKIPNPLSYYLTIAEKCLDFADEFPSQRYLIHKAYITF